MPLIGLLPLLFGLLSPHAQAAAPSGEDWFTLTTPHFRVHHTAPLEAYARAFGRSLERSLPLLEQDLRWKAPAPVDIVVMDSSDSANGFAANFPNTHIEVYAVPFETDSVLTYYVDWVDELATHELTHIVANDSAVGFYLTLRKIFGSWVKPNGLQPVWLIEGLAVYTETKHTPGGRGRSPWLAALLRQAVSEKKLTDPSYTSLDRLNSGNEWWPGGSAPYLLGYTIQALGAKKHPNLPGELSINNAGRVPFFPDDNLQDVAGKNWNEIWDSAEQTLGAHFTPPSGSDNCELTRSGRYTGGHALSPDGWVYFTEEDFDNGIHLARVKADAPCGSLQVERLYHKWFGGPSQVAVNEDGSLVAFTQTTKQHFEHFFSDLFFYDPATGQVEKVTEGKRARDPAFSGENVFYVSQAADTTQLIVRRNIKSGDEAVLWRSKPLERVAGLHARGEQLVFSLHNNRGHEHLHLLSVNGGEAKPVLTAAPDREYERNPFLLPDGQILYAYSAGSTQEIRRADPAKQTSVRMATVKNGLVDRPVLLPNGKELLTQAYTLGGMNLARVEISEYEHGITSAGTDLHEFLTGEAPPALDVAAQAPADFGPSEPYSALHTTATSLWPQYWMPVASVEEEGVLVGASTSGNDPLEYHRYGILAQYDSRAQFPRYRVFYRNRRSPTNIHFEANQSNNYFSSTDVSNRNATYSGEAIIPLGGFSSFSFGGAFQERTLFKQSSDRVLLTTMFRYEEVGARPAAMDPNFGAFTRAYVGFYPESHGEKFFLDMRPEAGAYFRGIDPSHSVGIVARAGLSTNKLLASNYYQGGGLSILSDSALVVRGYPVDALLGQRLATVNFSYTVPLTHPFRGLGTAPIFLESLGLRFHADAGSANYVSQYQNGVFQFYQPGSLGSRTLVGFGLELLGKGSVFYHVPVSTSFGLHYGPQKRFGGDLRFFLGLNIGLLGDLGYRAAATQP